MTKPSQDEINEELKKQEGMYGEEQEEDKETHDIDKEYEDAIGNEPEVKPLNIAEEIKKDEEEVVGGVAPQGSSVEEKNDRE